MAIATVDDVDARLDRDLTPEERDLAAVLLNDAEVKIRRRARNLVARAAADPEWREALVMVEANAVLRVLRNPEGYRQETDGNYSYSLSAAVAAGHLYIMASEWEDLGLARRVGSVAPKVRRPRRGITSTWKDW
ncbi:Gp19/Gp15/Gp42 family protein [Nocardiopsis aegyptia]|uniref:Gp19/Gp15/Gp42 family protein n=1 Tax=Nocardiopsis aegyptia TaxID=220378 RepID=UPI00366A890F